MRLAALLPAVLVLSVVSLRFLPAPYVWIFWSWLLVCIYLARDGSNTAIRVTAVNVGAVLLVLGGFEAFLFAQAGGSRKDDARDQDGKKIERNIEHDILGWIPRKSEAVSWKRYFGGTLLFDVVYTIDRHGLRVSPEGTSYRPSECILFFGGSFTFGAGVEDDETMPYLVGARYRDRYRVHNFGYSAYGAHQMLARIEKKMVADTINCQPKHFVYLGITDHARRSVNNVTWAKEGPKYLLGTDGEVVYSGQFDEPEQAWTRSSLASKARGQLGKSWIVNVLKQRSRLIAALAGEVSADDISLYIAIVDASRTLLEESYPGSEFHVIIWDDRSWLFTAILAGLEERGLRVHQLSEIFPDFFDKRLDYVLSKADGHPNRRAHEALAEYVSERIIER